jgi:hypothetical protein
MNSATQYNVSSAPKACAGDSNLVKTQFSVHFAKFGSSVGGIVSELPTNCPDPLIWTVGKNQVDLQLLSSENNADKADFPFRMSAGKARMRGLVVLSLFAISALGQPFNPVAKERAPESILQLPEGVRRDLVNRQCVVPKYLGYVGTEDQAYTKGHFRSGTSVDYAVVWETRGSWRAIALINTNKAASVVRSS